MFCANFFEFIIFKIQRGECLCVKKKINVSDR